jgi:hypothetical protein
MLDMNSIEQQGNMWRSLSSVGQTSVSADSKSADLLKTFIITEMDAKKSKTEARDGKKSKSEARDAKELKPEDRDVKISMPEATCGRTVINICVYDNFS